MLMLTSVVLLNKTKLIQEIPSMLLTLWYGPFAIVIDALYENMVKRVLQEILFPINSIS
jgi:hypothetical protein